MNNKPWHVNELDTVFFEMNRVSEAAEFLQMAKSLYYNRSAHVKTLQLEGLSMSLKKMTWLTFIPQFRTSSCFCLFDTTYFTSLLFAMKVALW
jgi:hypothetical protein